MNLYLDFIASRSQAFSGEKAWLREANLTSLAATVAHYSAGCEANLDLYTNLAATVAHYSAGCVVLQ